MNLCLPLLAFASYACAFPTASIWSQEDLDGEFMTFTWKQPICFDFPDDARLCDVNDKMVTKLFGHGYEKFRYMELLSSNPRSQFSIDGPDDVDSIDVEASGHGVWLKIDRHIGTIVDLQAECVVSLYCVPNVNASFCGNKFFPDRPTKVPIEIPQNSSETSIKENEDDDKYNSLDEIIEDIDRINKQTTKIDEDLREKDDSKEENEDSSDEENETVPPEVINNKENLSKLLSSQEESFLQAISDTKTAQVTFNQIFTEVEKLSKNPQTAMQSMSRILEFLVQKKKDTLSVAAKTIEDRFGSILQEIAKAQKYFVNFDLYQISEDLETRLTNFGFDVSDRAQLELKRIVAAGKSFVQVASDRKIDALEKIKNEADELISTASLASPLLIGRIRQELGLIKDSEDSNDVYRTISTTDEESNDSSLLLPSASDDKDLDEYVRAVEKSLLGDKTPVEKTREGRKSRGNLLRKGRMLDEPRVDEVKFIGEGNTRAHSLEILTKTLLQILNAELMMNKVDSTTETRMLEEETTTAKVDAKQEEGSIETTSLRSIEDDSVTTVTSVIEETTLEDNAATTMSTESVTDEIFTTTVKDVE